MTTCLRTSTAGRRGLACLVAASLVVAQQQPAPPGEGRDDDEVVKLGPLDPYTGGDAERMQAAGIVAYGPFPWADGKSTADVDKVLGERRLLWLETAHFRLGLGLHSAAWPEDQQQRRYLQEEIQQLRKQLPKVPERPKRLDPWLRLHLYAQRFEALYADFQGLLGVRDADFPVRGPEMREGAYLGMPGKFLVLLCQKKADLARYADRFCGCKQEVSMRWFHPQTRQLLAAVAAEGLQGFDELGLCSHVHYQVAHNLLDGYQGYYYPLPLWLGEGLAHWFERRVPTDAVNAAILDTEAVAADRQNDWPVKVRRRAQHVGAFLPFTTMAGWEKFEQLGYHAHAQAWSRVDFLMQLDREKLGLLVQQLKGLPLPVDQAQLPQRLRAHTEQLLGVLFGLDPAGFDAKWREWVLKTYPKK